MLVGVQSVAAGAVDKFMDGGVEALLVGTAYEEDGAIFQDSLRNLIARVANAIGDLLGSSRPNFFRGNCAKDLEAKLSNPRTIAAARGNRRQKKFAARFKLSAPVLRARLPHAGG